jgi:SRSO17 transposase
MIFFPKSTKIKTFLRKASLDGKALHYVVGLVTAFLMHCGRMSASQAGQAVRTEARHRANVARFLADCRWSRSWSECLWSAVLLLEEERRRPGRWLFILDQTASSQQGKKTENTYSSGNRKRRRCQGRRYGKVVHNRKTIHMYVMGLLITPGGLRLPVSKSYYTKNYCENKKRPYRTQTELGAELIRELQVPSLARVTVLGDTAYEAKVIRESCAERNYTWIVPLNPERVLAGKKPRPKVRTLLSEMKADQFVPVRLNPNKGRFVAQRRLSRCRIGPKVKSRTFYVRSETREVHSIGMAQLVFSCKEQPKNGKPIPLSKILVTNNLTLKPGEVVEMYSLRWQIELFFKELKSTLGFHHYRFRQYEKVETWVQIALVAFLFLEWTRGRHLRSRRLSTQEKNWWRSQRTHGLCRAVRQTAEEKELIELTRMTHTKTGIKALKKLLSKAQPLEYRMTA